MSYLDVPRLHFAGGFRADPSTVNNEPDNYDPDATLQLMWNPAGKHDFSLRECTVRSAVDASGVVRRTVAEDALVSGPVVASRPAKLVDLDPSFQTGSQIWGLELRVSAAPGGGRMGGRMATATMRDVWFERGPEGFAKGVSAAYQSVLTDLSWEPGSGSPVLEELRRISPERLSVKFVAYAYDADNNPNNPQFTRGRIVGTIGPVQPGEPDHFLAARRASADPAHVLGSRESIFAAYGAVPFKLDPARNVVVLDLGNAVPEKTGGGEPTDLGTMRAEILEPPRETLGSIDYSKANYEITAGINELAVTPEQAQRLASAQFGITVSPPSGPLVAITERPAGLYVDATETVWRMDPDATESVELVATRFGAPLAGHHLSLDVSGQPASALSLAASSVQTDDAGRATVSFTAASPGHPREHLDGQCYVVGFYDGEHASPSNKLGQLHIRVFDRQSPVADPTWTDVRSIFTPYARLYPSMQDVFNLDDEDVVRQHLEQVRQRLNLPLEDPLYMPVTRDLSRDKRGLLLRWLDRGAP